MARRAGQRPLGAPDRDARPPAAARHGRGLRLPPVRDPDAAGRAVAARTASSVPPERRGAVGRRSGRMRRAQLVAVAAALPLLLAACGGGSDSSSGSDTTGGSSASGKVKPNEVSVKIVDAG